MNEEEKAIIEEKLIEVYKLKGITFEDESLYKEKEIDGKLEKIFKESSDMPILEDLYKILEKSEDTKNFKIKLIPFIKGSLKFFNHITNIEIKSKLIVADIYELRRRKYKISVCIFLLNYFSI